MWLEGIGNRQKFDRILQDTAFVAQEVVHDRFEFIRDGNEADHIIISIVRTKEPGFMNNPRRTNIMLSRCKKSMMICTNREFLENTSVAETLFGQLAKEHVLKTGWVTLKVLATRRWRAVPLKIMIHLVAWTLSPFLIFPSCLHVFRTL